MLKKSPKLTVKHVLTTSLGILDQSPGEDNEESWNNLRICLKCLLHDRESLKHEKKALEAMLRNHK